MSGQTTRLRVALGALSYAEDEALLALAEAYPAGTRITFKIRPTQIKLSAATVLGHVGGRDGTMIVRLHDGHLTRASLSQSLEVEA